MKRFGLILAAFLGLVAQALPASADLLFTLNQGGSAFSTPGNYGTVKLHLTSANVVTVTVTLAAGETFAGTGAGYAIAWNIAGNPSLSNVQVTSANAANFTVKNFSSGQSYKASPFTSGFTDFMYAIEYTPNGGNGTDTSLVFDITNGAALSLTNFTNNSGGFRFAVDIAKNGNTGNVACKGDGVTVPEPQAWLMFFAGLLGLTGLVLLQRRRKLARA